MYHLSWIIITLMVHKQQRIQLTEKKKAIGLNTHSIRYKLILLKAGIRYRTGMLRYTLTQ